MASVASQLIEEVTAHAQSDSLEDAREICADGTYFPNNLRIIPDVNHDSSVDKATPYGLYGPGTESRWVRDFPHPSKPSIEPTQSPIRWETDLSPRGKGAGR